jgi:hypothetical protein
MYTLGPLSHNTSIRLLVIAFGDDLSSNTIGCVLTCSIVILHVNSAAGRLRQSFQELHVHLRIVGAYEGKSHECSASKMLAHKSIYRFSIFEAAEQRREIDRLVVQRKHNLMNHCKGRTAGFS